MPNLVIFNVFKVIGNLFKVFNNTGNTMVSSFLSSESHFAKYITPLVSLTNLLKNILL